jgi:hypothetical protein
MDRSSLASVVNLLYLCSPSSVCCQSSVPVFSIVNEGEGRDKQINLELCYQCLVPVFPSSVRMREKTDKSILIILLSVSAHSKKG